uniref:Uncharacterized protein n=1 Tax=Setaria italica TaxID=4555 RepID=K4AKY5_SETIT
MNLQRRPSNMVQDMTSSVSEALAPRSCPNLTYIFPSLLQLWEHPELTSLYDGVLPSLKNLKVKGCAKSCVKFLSLLFRNWGALATEG